MLFVDPLIQYTAAVHAAYETRRPKCNLPTDVRLEGWESYHVRICYGIGLLVGLHRAVTSMGCFLLALKYFLFELFHVASPFAADVLLAS